MPDRRCVHLTDHDSIGDPTLYREGREQGQLALQCYHYLCAAIQEKYELTTVPPDVSRGQLFRRAGLVFRYPLYALEPCLGIKLHPRSDGTIHPDDIKFYARCIRENWKCSQGGILYCIYASEREFWNIILNYHSASATTGIKAWDRLFSRLKAASFDKALVPCMFFGTPGGCLNPNCPFLHDTDRCFKERERILDRRRIRLGKPPLRDIAARERIALRAYRAEQATSQTENESAMAVARLTMEDDEDEELDPELQRIFDESSQIQKICNNPECHTVRMRRGAEGEDAESVRMLRCSRCSYATYCSKECQVADWKRHKKEPCRPFEEVVEDDDLWNDMGERKGTGRFRTDDE